MVHRIERIEKHSYNNICYLRVYPGPLGFDGQASKAPSAGGFF